VNHAFQSIILEKYTAHYDYCGSCGFLSAREPFWLDEAYDDAIAFSDTGLVERNISLARKLSAILYLVFNERRDGYFLDEAGGYGLLTRLMRDYGFDFYWEDKFCDNIFAKGFEEQFAIGECRAVTAMEVMEHIEDPLSFVEDILNKTKSDTFIFTTVLFSGYPPAPGNWHYYSFETGQHISFYQKRTLAELSKRLDMKFYSSNGIHIFTKRRISKLLLSLCSGRLNLLLSPFVRGMLGCRIVKDHNLIVTRLNIQNKDLRS